MNEEESAFLEYLFNKYYNNLYDIAAKMTGNGETALDVVQETFYIASKKVSKLYKHPNHEGWLYKTLNNKIKEAIRSQNYIKSNGKISVILFDFWSEIKASFKEPQITDTYFATLQDIEFLDKFKNILSNRELEFVKLKYVEELSNTEIANKFNTTNTAVSTMGNKVRKKIKNFYENGDNKP